MRKIEVVLVTLVAVFFLSSIAWAVDCPIPDTGQTKCYDNSQEITCPNPGEPFYGQDGNYTCNPHSYNMLASGIMVQDNVTGLIWENKTDDGTIHDKDNTYNWYDAQDVFIATLNNDNFGGHSDWRLPTIMELSFLVDRDKDYPSINTTYFPNTVSSYYWSSTTDAGDPSGAWDVSFYSGYVLYDVKSDDYYVRAVRSGQCGEFGNFVANGDGTVTDMETGLMWQQGTAPSIYSWQEALFYCENLTLASHNDWRLPNVNELHSIVDYSTYDPSINTDYFPNTESSGYWSSTTSWAHYPDYAWCVGFSGGHVGHGDKSAYGGYVRAVRGGQCEALTTTTTSTIPQPCVSESLYGEYSEQTELLRYFRDNVLSKTPEGQEIIRLYYELSPAIIKAMEEDEQFREEVKKTMDGVLQLLEKQWRIPIILNLLREVREGGNDGVGKR